MAEWRLWSRWPAAAVKARLERASTGRRNFEAAEEEMASAAGITTIPRPPSPARRPVTITSRARVALANYQFSDPAIVLAHFDPAEPLLGRCILLEIHVLGLHYHASGDRRPVHLSHEAEMVRMTTDTLKKIVALGALTGMRSTAGLATLAFGHRSVARPLAALAAAGEMIADKTSFVGDRIDPLPLAGRVIMGAGVGALTARTRREEVVLGSLVGAAAALIAAHLAYRIRKGLPLPSVVAGLLEDSLVLAIASRIA